MSGLDVAEQVKAKRPWTPVVIITGYGTDAAEARAKAAGVSGFVHKPLSPEMIEGSARDALSVPAVAANVVVLPVAAEAPKAEAAGIGSVLKNIALFFAAPFIGLAYIVAFPFVGFGMLAVLAGRAAAKNGTLKAAAVALKHVAMLLAAPIFGLVYILLFPFIGLALLLWMAGKAAVASVKG
jgi:CheY-like chemotaxis protein